MVEKKIFSEILYYNIILHLIFLPNIIKEIDGTMKLLISLIYKETSRYTTDDLDCLLTVKNCYRLVKAKNVCKKCINLIIINWKCIFCSLTIINENSNQMHNLQTAKYSHR